MQPTDHFFCGTALEDVNKMCNTRPCPDGTSTNCDHGQLCFKNTVCDARIRPDYGITQSPIKQPTYSPLASDAEEYFQFCGEDWAQANTCKMQWCGNGSECPNGQSCFADTECNMKDRLDGPPTLKPTKAPIQYNDPTHTSLCGFSFDDARSHCSAASHCPSGLHSECNTGEYCWVGTCNILQFTPPSASPTLSPTRLESDSPSTFPTSAPVKTAISQSPTSKSVSESSNSDGIDPTMTNRWCGHKRFDAYRNCGRPLYECPDGLCFNGLTCFVISNYCVNESALSLSPSPSLSNPVVQTLAPTPSPSVSIPIERETSSPTRSPSVSNPIKQTPSPTLHPTLTRNAVFFPPISKDPIAKSPNENIERVQHIIESVESVLRTEVFVFVTSGGGFITSSLYTYEGFLSALLFYSNTGVNGNYLYLGGEESANELINQEVEYGIANLALFIAKMMTDTIAYERCNPDLLACGLSALDTTLETQQLRFMCPPSSDMEGVECKGGGAGCACILGFLDQYIGSEGPASGKYSDRNFCSSDQSICNQSIRGGSELRWITALTHWVTSVQRHEENGSTFIDDLQSFVEGGMVDTAFLHGVANAAVIRPNSISRESAPTNEKFVENFFKVMTKLSEGHSQTYSDSAAPKPTMQQTAPPSTMSPSTAAPKPASTKPTNGFILLNPPPTPPPTDLQSVPPSSSPSLKAQSIDESPTKLPVVNPSQLDLVEGDQSLNTPESDAQPLCPTFCTEVVSIEECPSQDITVPFNIPFCYQRVGMDEMCRGNGYCGTKAHLDNCGKGRSVYRRVDCSSQTQSNEEASLVDEGVSYSPTASDTPCSLCRRDESIIDTGIILFNGKESNCAAIQSFLHSSQVVAGDAVCLSARNELSAACCEAKTVGGSTNEMGADDVSNVPFPSPVETIQPTQRGADLPWYFKFMEGQSSSSGGRGRQLNFHAGILIFLLSFLQL